MKSILLKSQVKEVLLENTGSAWLDGPVKVITGSASDLVFVPGVLCPWSAEKGAALPMGKGRPVCGADPGSGLWKDQAGRKVEWAMPGCFSLPVRSCECEAGASGPTIQRSSALSPAMVRSALPPRMDGKSAWGRMQVRVPVGLDDSVRKGLESPQAGS